jgi:hypothetical protein
MEIEVLSVRKASVAWRGWLATILLLLGVSVPAWWLSWARAGELQRTRVHPAGWSISFSPPNRFDGGEGLEGRDAHLFVYQRVLDVGFAELRVQRFEDASDPRGALELCERVVRPHSSLILAMMGPRPVAVARRLGGSDGIEVRHEALQMVVRAAVTEGAEGYAVSLRVEGSPIDEGLYRAFDAVCDSVMSQRGRGGVVLERGREPG